MPHTSSHLLTYRPPPCSNGPAFVFMCHTLLTFSPIGLLHVVMGRPLSSCATHFDSAPCISSSCTLSYHSGCCPVISFGPSPSSLSLHLHTISVVSFRGRLSPVRCWLLPIVQMSSFLLWSFLVLPLAHLSILISVVCSFAYRFS